ncbi:MAG: chemotaxis protein CheW [Minisyncoccia bacterium]
MDNINLKKEIDLVQVVLFMIDEEEYGALIPDLKEVIDMTKIKFIPDLPDFVLGILNLNGNVVIIIDLEKKFNLSCTNKILLRHIIVIEIAGNKFGIVVDEVIEVLNVPISEVKPLLSILSSKIRSHYLNNSVIIEEKKYPLVDLSGMLQQKDFLSLLASEIDTVKTCLVGV